MVLLSSRNYVRLDRRFWLFHDGDDRPRASELVKSPLWGAGGVISIIYLLWRSEASSNSDGSPIGSRPEGAWFTTARTVRDCPSTGNYRCDV